MFKIGKWADFKKEIFKKIWGRDCLGEVYTIIERKEAVKDCAYFRHGLVSTPFF
jgi:hypothetical protein